MDSDCLNNFLEISRMPGLTEMHIPLNFLEYFIRSHCYDAFNYRNSCVVSFQNVLEYFLNVNKDSVM